MNENNISSHDVSPYVHAFLTDKTKDAIKAKAHDLIYQYNKSVGGGTYVRHAAKVMFLGFSCASEDVGEAAQIICSKLNELAEKDFVVASMMTMTVIPFTELAPDPWKNKCAVMSYVAISLEGEEYIKKYLPYLNTPEGGVPKSLSGFKECNEDTSTYAISEE